MNSSIRNALVISTIFVASSYTMDEQFQCKIPRASTIDEQQKSKEDRKQKAIEQFKTTNNFCSPSSALSQEVENAFKVCNVSEPIVVLEAKHWFTSLMSNVLLIGCDEPMKILIIGTKAPTPIMALRFNMYHEIGHLINGDLPVPDINNLDPDKLSNMWSSALSGCAALSLFKMTQNLGVAARMSISLGGALATLYAAPKFYRTIIRAAQIRNQERKADLFAFQKLKQQNDIEGIIASVMAWILYAQANNRLVETPLWLLCDHPSDAERIRTILDQLRKAGINLADLPLDDASCRLHANISKQQVQATFNQMLEQHFPEFLPWALNSIR